MNFFLSLSYKLLVSDFFYLHLSMPTPPYIESEELQPIVVMVKPQVAKINEELQWLVKSYNG